MAGLSTYLPVALLFSKAIAVNNGLAITPPMGWNHWKTFGCDVYDEVILDDASWIKRLGLQDVGYHYVVVDDCWSDGRDENNELQPETRKFPSGMADIGDKLHAQGFGFGMYADAGSATCSGGPGSLGNETIDADTFASWGVDYLKYDNCNNEGQSGSEEVSAKRYKTMGEALNATGRDIVYSICNWGEDNPWSWGPSIGNSWRVSGDITDSFDEEDSNCNLPDSGGHGCSVLRILNKMFTIADSGGKGGWNDLDILEVGNRNMSEAEYKTQFSMWSVLKSPLMMSTSIPNLYAAELSILTNPALIAVNQDPLGKPAEHVWTKGHNQLWVGALAPTLAPIGDDLLVALVNTGDSTTNITVTMDDMFGGSSSSSSSSARPASGNIEIRDLWGGRISEEQAQSIIDDGAAAHPDLLYNATETPYETGLRDGDVNEILLGTFVEFMGTERSFEATVEGHGCAVFRIRIIS